MPIVREYTDKLWEMMDEQIVDPLEIARACLLYMSEDEVADMMRVNGLVYWREEENNG